MHDFIQASLITISIFGLCYLVPFFIRKGWGDAENRTKKVCDVCYRDINKWNEAIKKAQKELSKS